MDFVWGVHCRKRYFYEVQGNEKFKKCWHKLFCCYRDCHLEVFDEHLRNCNRNCNHCFVDIETVIMKLFDRSVDLALFPEDTPLYPVCRAWIQNRPHDRSLGTILGRPPSPKQEEEVGMFEWLYLIAQLAYCISHNYHYHHHQHYVPCW